LVVKRLIYTVGLSIGAIWSFYACNRDDTKETEDILFEKISGFVINEQGDKFVATDKGLYFLDVINDKYEFVTSKIQHTPLNDLAYSETDPVKELWLASNTGVFNFTLQLYVTKANSGLLNDRVNHLNFDNNSSACFATPEGISILNNDKWTNYSGLDNLYLNFEITDMSSATNGFTYVTTYGGGVERFKINIDGISGATTFDTDWTMLESNNINTVFIDDTTQVYGTDAGVAMHFSEYTKWNWLIYTTSDGLICDTVLAIVKDHSDNWWFGTTQGISRLDDSEWTNYSIETHNIISNDIKFLAVDIDGSVWFASDKGLSQFIDEQWVNYSK
jgi:ligand-binding sensor domain-containing protein